MHRIFARSLGWVFVATLVVACASPAFAANPVVKTVPWVSGNSLIPHDTYSGRAIRLKGTADVSGSNITYMWDFGDGSAVASGIVSNPYAIEALHAYTGPVGTVFSATLTVQNTTTGETGTGKYFVEIRPQNLETQANIAIDEGLWYLHKTLYRYTSGTATYGNWASGSGYATYSYMAVTAANVNAFFVNGHRETSDPGNPYVDDVQRVMRWLFGQLYWTSIATSQTNPLGTFNPDVNGNGIGLYIGQGYPIYQGGPTIDAIVASGTPDQVTTTGGANVVGRSYRDIVQDLVDFFSYCQYDGSTAAGGWRYNCNDFPDNSAAQWGAIGLLAARGFGAKVGPPADPGVIVPDLVRTVGGSNWLPYSQHSNGSFGYTNTSPVWGPYATTPSGMVQLAMAGIGRGNALWDKAETYMRNNFGNSGGASVAVKDYYYGLFALVKAMLLHDANGDGVAEPLQDFHSTTPGVTDIDWYSAEVALGAPTDGVARTLINDQSADGYWWGHNMDSAQYRFETAWAIMMLRRKLFTSGGPVAVASAVPNPATAGATITLDGSASFHLNPDRTIVQWEWDLDNDGAFDDATGVITTTSFSAVGSYTVRLRVTDDAAVSDSASTALVIVVSTPPLAPTADAGGPYNFCLIPGTNFFLSGLQSVNPDDGLHDPGAPADFITGYAWDLDGDGVFDDATGPTPNVTSVFTVPASLLIQLRVTDNTALSFPSSGMGNLSDTDSAQVFVRAATDPLCACSTLNARARTGQVQLTYTLVSGADHYEIYRSTVNGGPYTFTGLALGTQTVYYDKTVVNGTTYYYVVRPAAINGTELCQSNQVSAKPMLR